MEARLFFLKKKQPRTFRLVPVILSTPGLSGVLHMIDIDHNEVGEVSWHLPDPHMLCGSLPWI